MYQLRNYVIALIALFAAFTSLTAQADSAASATIANGMLAQDNPDWLVTAERQLPNLLVQNNI